MVTANPPHPSAHSHWVVSYTQRDVDTIREQIEQNESAKRRWLFLALMIAVAALVGVVILVSSSYALYSKSESDKRRLTDENAALKTASDQYQQQLKTATAAAEGEAQARNQAQARLGSLMPALLRGASGEGDTAAFAHMVAGLPYSRVEVEQKPPDKLFRNWRYRGDSGIETYTLVGGFVDGKWVIHSNLVARSGK
jgi:cell division protein FtsB